MDPSFAACSDGCPFAMRPGQIVTQSHKVKSHGLYELKSGMFAKSAQVTWTPSLGLHFTLLKNASLALEKLE